MIHLISISSDICEDSYEHGELASTGCGLPKTLIDLTFHSFDEATNWLNQHYDLPKGESNYEITDQIMQTDKLVADHTQAQNGGWMEPTLEEIGKWKEGLQKLYVEHYFISFRYGH